MSAISMEEIPLDKRDAKVSDLMDSFVCEFNKLKAKIEDRIEDSKSFDRDALPAHFNDIKSDIQELQKFISESTKFLPSFNIKVALGSVKSLVDRTELEQGRLIPKKKFAFKKTDAANNRVPPAKDAVDSKRKTTAIVVNQPSICGFENLQNEKVEKLSSEMNGKDVGLSSCTDCTIILYGYPSTVHMSKLKRCRVYLGPVTTSVFVEECTDCQFSVACQQLRVHSTSDCDFCLHVTSRGIVEDCKGLRFGRYAWTYPDLESDFQRSGLNPDTNNWSQIDDFNWLSKDVPSPNWSILENAESQIGDAI